MTEQHIKIDVSAITRGMKRVDQEKEEIAMILNLLAPHLIEMAQAAYSRRVPSYEDGGMHHETIPDLIIVGDPAKSHLRITSDGGHGGSYFSYPPIRTSLYWKDSRLNELFHQCEDGRVLLSTEGIPSGHVGFCHTLLDLLITKVLEAYPDMLLQKLEVFYEAAERAAK